MKRTLVLTATLASGLLGNGGLAGHVEPMKANKVDFELVNGFVFCDGSSVNTATQSNGTPACTPAAPADVCAFLPTGSGKLMLQRTGSAVMGTQDVKIAVRAKGLNPFCEGIPLSVTLSYRLVTDDCPEGSCTTVDVQHFEIAATCIATEGKCKIKTTLNAAAPGLIATNGENAGIVIMGCGLDSPPPLGGPDISCGLLLP
jgi:hypothetical protein